VKDAAACTTDKFSSKCNTWVVPISTVDDYKYTMTYNFKDATTKKEYTETIDGTLSVKSCKGSYPRYLTANCTKLICGAKDSKGYDNCDKNDECKNDVSKCTWDICQNTLGKTNPHCMTAW
jgi:hypothetical protein